MLAPHHAPSSGSSSLFGEHTLGDIWTWVRHGVGAIAQHSGVPVVIVAALAVVLSLRLAKRAVQILIEVAVVAVMLVVATHFGWIRW